MYAKKNNTPIEDVMKAVAKENEFTYIPLEKRTQKMLVFEKDSSGNIVALLKDDYTDSLSITCETSDKEYL